MMIHLLSDLIRNFQLRKRFADEGPAILNEYGIDEKTRALLLSNQREAVAALVAVEALQILKTLSEPVLRPLYWPMDPGIQVHEIQPTHAVSGQETEFVLSGQEFEPRAEILFSMGSSDPHDWVYATQVEVSEDGTKARGKVFFKSGQEGWYSAYLINPATAGDRRVYNGSVRALNVISRPDA